MPSRFIGLAGLIGITGVQFILYAVSGFSLYLASGLGMSVVTIVSVYLREVRWKDRYRRRRGVAV